MNLRLKKEYLIYLWLSVAATNSQAQKYVFSHKWGGNGTANGKTAYPNGLAINSSGNICVSEAGNNRIEIFAPDGTFISKWGSTGSGNGQFVSPGKIAMDSDDNTYVCDQTNGDRVQKINSAGVYVSQWGGNGSGAGQFNFLAGLATDASNNVYVVDYFNARIQKFDASGTLLSSWGSFGTGDGQFSGLQDIAISSNGNIYVTEYDNSRIQKFDANGTFITKWGTYGTDLGQFDGPAAIAVDADENVYVADNGNNRIQKFNSNGAFITMWGRSGSADGEFNGPSEIVVDASGNVYVADTYNHRIQVFSEETSTTWNGTSWSNGIPTVFLPAKIEGNYSGDSFECTTLLINDGVTLTINSGKYVQATVVNTLGSGKIAIQDGGSLNYTTYISGNVTVNKNASTGRYTMLAPIKSSSGGVNLPTSSDIYYYNEASRTPSDYTTGWVSGKDFDNSSTGYAVYNAGAFSINGILPYTSLPITIPVTKSSIASDDSKNGWNLIGNTTTCPLNIVKFLTLGINPSNINGGAIYIWDGSNYVAMNLGRIASYQGFFIKAVATGNLEIDLNMFSIANVGLLRTEEEMSQSLTLTISGQGKKDQTQIDFKEGASDLYSIQNDALKFSLQANPLSLASKIMGNNDLFAINTMSVPSSTNKTIPLIYSAQKAGSYTFSLSDFNLPAFTTAILVDNELKTNTIIKEQSYTFQSGVVENSSRFTLKVGPPTVTAYDANSEIESELIFYVSNDILHFHSNNPATYLQIVRTDGRQMFSGIPRAEMNISNWQAGIYIGKITSNGHTSSQKIVKQ
jgi:hypothetical protein